VRSFLAIVAPVGGWLPWLAIFGAVMTGAVYRAQRMVL